MTKDTLFKKWKRRALIYLGKAYTGLLEFKLAKNSFKAALGLIQSDPTLAKEGNEIRQLIVATTKKLEKESKSEKKMWSKALNNLEEEPKEDKNNKSNNNNNNVKSPSQQQSPTSPNSTKKDKKNKNKKGKQIEEEEVIEDIDLSEFGIGEKKNSNQNQLTRMNSPYVFLSIFSVFGLFAFYAFRSFKIFKS